MIIEFVGVPGSGKSTLFYQTQQFLTESNHPVVVLRDASRLFASRGRFGRLISRVAPLPVRDRTTWSAYARLRGLERFRFQRQHPGLVQHVIAVQSQRPAEARVRQRGLLSYFNRLVQNYTLVTRLLRPGEVLLMDEGFVHRVVQFYVSDVEQPNLDSMRAYLARIPRSDLVVHVTAPLDTCLSRVYQRGLWEHFADKNEQQIARFLANAMTVTTATVSTLQNQGWQVLEIDNSDVSPEPAYAALRAALQQFFPFG
jgi:thymidylate kinase